MTARPKNPFESLVAMANWCVQLGVRPEEVVNLSCDSFDKPTAHLHFSAMLRLWPDSTFPVRCPDSRGRPHLAFDAGPVLVVCIVEPEELESNRHRLVFPEIAEQPVEVADG